MLRSERAALRTLLGFAPEVASGGGQIPRGDWSASRAGRFRECRRNYQAVYVFKNHEPATAPMLIGGVDHKVIEDVSRSRLAGGDTDRPVLASELRAALDERCGHLTPAQVALAWTHLKPFAGKPGLPAIAAAAEVRDPATGEVTAVEQVATPAVPPDFGRLDLRQTVAVEEPVRLVIGLEPAAEAVGILDRLDYVELPARSWPPREGGWWWVIHDYKSGRWVPSYEEAEADAQVGFYLAVVHRLTGSHRVMMKLDYFNRDIPVEVEWTPDLDASAMASMRADVAAIRAETAYPPTVGTHCVGCHVRGTCPAYAAALRTPEHPLALAAAGDEELLVERKRARDAAEFFEQQRKDIDEVLRRKLATREVVAGGGLRAKLVSRQNYEEADLDATVAAFIEAGAGNPLSEITGVSKSKLKAALEKLPPDQAKTVRARLAELRVPFDAATYVDVRAASGPF